MSTPFVIVDFQELVDQVPEILQPLVVAAAGAIPFVEGEGAAVIGIVGGLNPVVSALAAAAGNFLCVALLVLLSSGARTAIVDRSAARGAPAATSSVATASPVAVAPPEQRSRSARREKVLRALERYGVPGVSLLGPLLVPTMITATALVAAGVSRARVLAWQAVAIAAWTTGVTVIASGVLSAVR